MKKYGINFEDPCVMVYNNRDSTKFMMLAINSVFIDNNNGLRGHADDFSQKYRVL
jgi:hypothetical protein